MLLTDILSYTVSELSQLIVQILDTLRFWAPFPFGGLGIMYDVQLNLIGKRVVDFLFSARCYGWDARAKIDRKSAISLQRGQFDPKFQVEWSPPTNHFCTDS